MARTLVRRLISPMELHDASKTEWQMPDFIRADAFVKPGLLDGLVPHNWMASLGIPTVEVYTEMASPMPASWNQITTWLRTMDDLRCAA